MYKQKIYLSQIHSSSQQAHTDKMYKQKIGKPAKASRFFGSQAGLSILEVLIALTLIVGVAAGVLNRVNKLQEKGKVKQAKIMITRLSEAIETFYMDCGYYPSTTEGLSALMSAPSKCESWGPDPYVKRLKKDPWNKHFIYEYDESTGNYEIISLGKGGKRGGKPTPHPTADISSNDL